MEITELTHASELDTCGIDIEKVMLCCTVSCIKDDTPFKKEITQFTEDYKIPIFAVVNPVPNEETEVTE